MSTGSPASNVPMRPSQKLAVESRGRNQLVLGGAGTGKTRVIVHRYLSLLEQGAGLGSIVVITFDKQACQALREQIRKEIERRTAPTTPRDTTRWIECLQEIDLLRVDTIHSLCAALLRENPAEAVVDPDLQTLDVEQAAVWQAEAIDAALAELRSAGGSALPLLRYFRSQTIEETLRSLLARGAVAQEAFATLPGERDALVFAWSSRLVRTQREGLAKLLGNPSFRECADWISGNAAKDPQDKLEKIRAEFAEQLGRVRGVDPALAMEGLRQIAEGKIGNVGGKRAWLDVVAAREHIFSLRFMVREFAEKYDLEIGPDDERAAGLVFSWRDLFYQVRAQYAARKARESVLDAEDLELRAAALLADHPEIRERYHAQFSCLLVDEFQEANAAQRDVIYALAPPSEPNRLFIAADPKQSIYGSRGANVSIVREAERDLVARWGADARILLNESLRPHNHLAQALNHLFSQILAAQDGARFETPYTAATAPRRAPPRDAVMEIIQVPGETMERGRLTEGERREWQAREIAARLVHLREEQFQVWDRQTRSDRSVGWADIALLFRSPEYIPVYEHALRGAHVPFVTWVDVDWFRRAEIQDLTQLLRALDEPLDDLAIAAVLRSPLYALSDETLYRLRQDGVPFRESLAAVPEAITGEERVRVEFAQASLESLWKLAGRISVLDLLKHAITETGLPATLIALDDGEDRYQNVKRFLELARRGAGLSLSEFNRHIRSLAAGEIGSSGRPQGTPDAIQVLTIHQAKGLEFPIVVIPEASQPAGRAVHVLHVDEDGGIAAAIVDETNSLVEPASFQLVKREAERREAAEEKRLLYVAATRAEEYLVICGGTKPKESTYLGQIQTALDGKTDFEWGKVLVRPPSTPSEAPPQPAANTDAGQVIPEDAGGAEEVQRAPELPPMSLPLPPQKPGDLRDLTSSALQLLVSDPAEFERTIMPGAPARLSFLRWNKQAKHAPVGIVDDITRQALLHWRLPDTCPELLKILEGYAASSGYPAPDQIQAAVHEARALLFKFQSSDLYKEMASAIVRRHKVPFVTLWEGRSIHGTLDALYQSATGRWFIADFKLDRLGKKRTQARSYTAAAYGVQIAICQAAAVPQWGQVPVRVHYLREDHTVIIHPGELSDVLGRAAKMIAGLK